jgi:hypothetical protein
MKNFDSPEFGNYKLDSTFELPVAVQSTFPIFDVLGDGRVISTDGMWVYVETNPGSRSFSQLKNLGGNYSAYIRVSPSGNKVAVDKSGTVVIFDVQTPDQELVYGLGGGFDVEWSDPGRLAISGTSNGVIVLDTNTGDKKIAIQNIGGLPGGVTFDHNQTLFCGNGGDKLVGGSQTGWIKAFSKTAWEQAIVSNTPINFEQNGVLVADLLSCAYLGFDKYRNMYVGGGVAFGTSGDVGASGEVSTPERGYACLISADALHKSLNDGSPLTRESPPTKLHQFDPDPAPDSWYFLNANRVTGEFYLKLYSENITSVYVFQKQGID